MSSTLVRQALEFVDPEENIKGKGKKRGAAGQGLRTQFKNKNKRPQQIKSKSEDVIEGNVKKLLKLSQKVADDNIADKIVERAVKGKALTDFIEVKKAEEEKSILFPDGDYSLKEYFGC